MLSITRLQQLATLCRRKMEPNKEILEHKFEGCTKPYRLHLILAGFLAGRGNLGGEIF
jgi:hypothetical protein